MMLLIKLCAQRNQQIVTIIVMIHIAHRFFFLLIFKQMKCKYQIFSIELIVLAIMYCSDVCVKICSKQ